ncbi:hypothetical protein CAAN1_03S03004 [[Candida] anglica]|uniref:Gluconokinase n=1 Tax=[Candida] anglica TaxID=148631 RepID=A0ABP0EGT6_9ASCO
MLVIVVGGPAGTGKTTLAEMLAEKLHCPFTEGDQLHPQVNLDKMSSGIPLTDEDRWDWLANVSVAACKHGADPSNKTGFSIVSCSMLKKIYRDHIVESAVGENVEFRFVFLYSTLEELYKRVDNRKGHFMKSDMVTSQYEIMEVPSGKELIENGGSALAVDTTGKGPQEVFAEVAKHF